MTVRRRRLKRHEPRSRPIDPTQRRSHDPAARLRRLPDRARGDRRGGRHAPWRSATGTSTPPRCTATSAGSARPCAPPGSTAPRSSSPASSTTARTGPTTRGGRSSARSSELGFDYVDLFLIHWPLPTLYDGDFVSTWKALEEFQRDGRARSIGVSNFQVAHLERLAAETDVVPAVNQIELHPYFLNDEVRAYGEDARDRHRGVVADRPGRGARRPGDRRDRPAARPDAGAGRAALAHPARQHRVPEVDDARADRGELRAVRLRSSTPDDIEAIDALDRGEAGRIGPNPDAFAYVPA